MYLGTLLQFGIKLGPLKDWSNMVYGLAPGHCDLSVGALGNLLMFGPNNQAKDERLTLHAKFMGAGGGVVSLDNAWEIIKNLVNLPTNKEALENITRIQITTKTLLSDTHPIRDWLYTPSCWRTMESSRSQHQLGMGASPSLGYYCYWKSPQSSPPFQAHSPLAMPKDSLGYRIQRVS